MQRFILFVLSLCLLINIGHTKTLDVVEIYERGLSQLNENQSVKTNANEKEVSIGGLIQRHPLLNHIRNLFSEAKKVPSITDLKSGKTWSCLKFTGLDFQSELMKITTVRNLSFESFGAGIIKEVSYGSNSVSLYANDDGELAGITNSGDMYEAIRLSTDGDLILESSVQGLGWWRKFFLSLIGEGRTLKKLLAIVQKTMVSSVSNTENKGLVFDYTVCPATKVIDDVITH